MNIEYINPFIEASQSVLKMMLGIDVKLGKVYLKSSPYMGDSAMIIVGLTGRIRGQAVFCMSKSVAIYIASIMMGGIDLKDLDEIGKSAISELTNMILGNTATILEKTGVNVEITPPSFVMGDNMQISSNKVRIICIPLILDPNDPSKVINIDINIAQDDKDGEKEKDKELDKELEKELNKK